MNPTTKVCRGCDTERPLADFHRHARTKDGLQARCKECQKKYAYKWRQRNPERYAAIARRSYVNVGRDNQRSRLYGIPASLVAALAEVQGHKCMICGRPESESPNGLHLDHDHATGIPRGLLCLQCNTALGKFQDDPALLRRAADYLERPRTP